MNAFPHLARAPRPAAVVLLSLLCVLSACGGGSSDAGGSSGAAGGGTAPTSPWPTSGSYAVVLRASGSTTAGATAVALSLVHPTTPQVEYVMDAAGAPSTLGLTLYQGTYDAPASRFTALSPVAYVDAPSGTLRTTLLAANGARPQQATGPTQSLCANNLVADDVADPFASVILAATPGADATCATADDGQVLIGFSSAGVPNATPVTGYVGFLRSAATGAPVSWLVTDSSGAETVTPFAGGGTATVVAIGTPGANVHYARVQDLSDTLLYSRNGALMGLGVGSGGIARHTLSTSTGPDGWKSAGHDATAAYAYLNSGTAQSGVGTWQLLAVSRADLSVRTLATGTGSIFAASALPGAVYATVLDASSGSHVTKVDSTTDAQSTAWASNSQVTAVEANPGGLNTVITATSTGAISLSLIDDQGTAFYSQDPGMVYGADGNTIDESSGDQVFAGVDVVAQPGSTYLGGVTVTRVDAATRTSRVLGTLPTGADLGGLVSEQVFVTPLWADGSFGAFSASRLSGTQLVSAGSAVYTFNPQQANSMVRVTSQVH